MTEVEANVEEILQESESDVDTDDDVESVASSISNRDDNDESEGNVGWADSMTKILKSNKPKAKKSIVLSKAKKDTDKREKKTENVGFEIIGDGKTQENDTTPVENDEPPVKKKRDEERHPNFRVKPNILEREREKILSKIATRGVVQLFNTVRNQQKDIEKKLESAGPIERKKDKIMKSLDKNKFLDVLMGQTKSEVVNKTLISKVETKNVKKEESNWDVFRDDFMMGAKMKDWDKKATEENDEKIPELTDSDSE